MGKGTGDSDRVTVRLARTSDARHIATLCLQLGYPASQGQVQRRLERIQQENHHALYVAERSDGQVIGWIHAYVRHLVVVDAHAEVGGLIVDQDCRKRGVGRLLMQTVEQWARRQGCRAVRVRSNVVREGAHAFYKRIGYSTVKTQAVFYKEL